MLFRAQNVQANQYCLKINVYKNALMDIIKILIIHAKELNYLDFNQFLYLKIIFI
jgi:hypothetical protein